MSAKRDDAAKILARIPLGEGIRSDKQPDDFFRWTGYTQDQMMESWRANMSGPVLLTACGGFASKFAGLIGISGIASFFDLEKSLNDAGMGYAWVAASSGAKPQVGDILRHTVFHVDVAAGWDGGKLKRVAAGQSSHPRPTDSVENEFDCLKWVTGAANYNPANLQGWLDLDKYFGGPSSAGSGLDWLTGWWRVVEDGNTYYYFFGAGGDVQYITTPPSSSASGPPSQADNVGSYTYSAPTLVLTWCQVAGASTNCVETFYNATAGCQQMNATSNLYSPLAATRIS